jgi:hypothetical protein
MCFFIGKETNMRPKTICFYLLAVALGGCLPLSIHPLYTDDTMVFEEKLVGKWADGDEIWQFSRDGENAYELRIVDDGKEGYFNAHLVQLENMLFLDIIPDSETLKDVQSFYQLHLLPTHTFIRIEQTEPNLVLQMMGLDKVKEILRNDPNLLKHEVIEDDGLVLTAAAQDLQKFIVEYANTEGVFGDEKVFSRREPLCTVEDVIFDERLIGEWEDSNGVMLNSIRAGDKGYDMIIIDKGGAAYRFLANLVKVNGSMLLAISFDSLPLGETDPCAVNITPDYVVLVEQIEPKLLIRDIDYEDTAKMSDAALLREKSEAYIFEGTRTMP